MQSFAVVMCKTSPGLGAFREPAEDEPDTSVKKSCKNSLTGFAEQAYSAPVAKRLTADDVIRMMRAKQGKRSDSEFASALGISKAYLCDLYKGRRTPGETILSQLGLVKRQPEPFYEVA